jgi:hypothetical protein
VEGKARKMVNMVTVVHKVVILPNGRTPFDLFALGTLRLYDSDVGFAVSKMPSHCFLLSPLLVLFFFFFFLKRY